MKWCFILISFFFIPQIYSQTEWKTFNTSNGLVDNNITAVAVDSQNNLWIGTYNGVQKYDGIKWETYNVTNTNGGLVSNYITSLVIDNVGKVWIGSNGAGISMFNDNKWTSYTFSTTGSSINSVSSIVIDSLNNKWFSTFGGGIYKFDDINWTNYNSTNSDIDGFLFSDIKIDMNGNIWTSDASSKNFKKFDGKKWSVVDVCNQNGNSIIDGFGFDKNNNLWIGREDNNLIDKYNGDSCQIFGLTDVCEKNQPSLNSRPILIDGNLWVLTNQGISIYNENNWKRISTCNSGLIDNNVSSVAIDKNGNKWIGTSKGLSYLYKCTTDSLCMVTNYNNHNLLVWNNKPNTTTKSFRIYKQSKISSQYEVIAEQKVGNLSQFLDTLSSPSTQIERYKISAVDSNGTECSISPNHTTILLSSSLGINETVNLSWNAYEGFAYDNFEIWRSTDGNVFSKLGSVANNTFSYIDNNPPVKSYYQLRITNPKGCVPEKRTYSYVNSNTVDKTGKSVAGLENKNILSSVIYPNPTSGSIYVSNIAEGSILTITSISGQVILTQKTENNTIELPISNYVTKGIYILTIQTNESEFQYQKFVFE
jgi:streptogramin lyase